MPFVHLLRGLLLAAACSWWLTPAVLAQGGPPAAESFFQKPATSGARLSPDGRKLALRLQSPGKRSRLAVIDLRSMKPDVVASFDDASIDHFQWVNDRRLVFNLEADLVGPARVGSRAAPGCLRWTPKAATSANWWRPSWLSSSRPSWTCPC
jgi:hypothetical protein